jgi:hypothetical protein
VTPPQLPEIDESKFARVTVEFSSGTPAMTYWCSRMSLAPNLVRLDIDLDGAVKPLVKIRRDGIRQLVVDFDARPEE